ncbi:MAG: acyl-CoA dehydrogenase [Chloroflexi bacterium]|nr:acyl-CoA dehydrogenase [Chloroflexota bacterium]
MTAMVDFNVTEEQRHWQGKARDWARSVLAPVVREVEGRPEPLDRIPWPEIAEASHRGLRLLSMPAGWGGVGAGWRTLCLVVEEVAAVDIGTATTLELQWMYGPMLYALMEPAQRERFLRPMVDDPTFLLAPCLTEPNVGSDSILPYNRADGGIRTLAHREAGGWVVNGRKHFTSSGGVAKLYLLFARTDLSQPPLESTSLFVLTPDLPGFTVVRGHEKLAHRLSPQAEEVFENLKLSEEHHVGPVGGVFAAARAFMMPALALAGAGFVGTARGAFELALQFARDHVRGGRPLLQRQATALQLVDMQMRVEAARCSVLNAASRFDSGDLSEPALASRVKVFASEVSFDVARMATEIFGGRGVMTDYEVERFLRDATANLHDFGANQVHKLRAAAGLGHEVAG